MGDLIQREVRNEAGEGLGPKGYETFRFLKAMVSH